GGWPFRYAGLVRCRPGGWMRPGSWRRGRGGMPPPRVAAEPTDGADAAPVGLGAFPGARVLLLGTGSHEPDSRLPDVPAVADTLADLRSALVTCCGLAEQAVRVVADPTVKVMGQEVAEAAEAAEGPLVVDSLR